MIADTDTVSLAPGVSLGDRRLIDGVRGDSWPLNPSATFVLERAGRPLGTVVSELAEGFGIPGEDARADVLGFLWLLNSLALVNLETGLSRLRRASAWIHLAARLAPAGAVPTPLTRRHPLDTRSVRRAVTSTLAALLPRVLALAATAMLVAGHVIAIGGSADVGVPLALGLGTGLGLGLHEAAHAACLRGVPSALVTRGPRTYVLHPPLTPPRRSAVALAGPLAVTAIGLACVIVAPIVAVPLLAVAGLPLAAHALALTVVGGDGRVACES